MPLQATAVIDVAATKAITVSNSDDTYLVSTSSDLELPDIAHTDSDGSSVPTPAQTAFVCSQIRVLIFFFQASAGDEYTATIGASQAGTYDLDAATLTNVATVAYEKNAGVVTGVQSFVATDTLKVTITRTNDANDSEVELTT